MSAIGAAEPLRILWMTANFHPEVGGLQTYSAALPSLMSMHHRVMLITDAGQSLPTPGSIEHVSCPGLGGACTMASWVKANERVARIVREFAPNVIHLANAGMAVYVDAGALPPEVPVVATVHGNDLTSPWQRTGDKQRPVGAIVGGLQRCSKVVAVSDYVAGLLKQRAEVLSVVIHNGCDLGLFRPSPWGRDEILGRCRIPSGPPMVLTVGRLVARKGHRYVLDALAGIQDPWHWVVVGGGEMSTRLKWSRWRRGLSSRITLLDWVPSTDLAALMNACDIFVMTPTNRQRPGSFDTEGFGLVYHEAGACGKPVIGSNIAGCREAVLDGETGLLVPPDNVLALRSAVLELLRCPERRALLGEQGRRHVLSAGGWHAVARRLVEIYRGLVDKASPVGGVA